MHSADKKPLGIYIHIPFCVQKCRYCDFCSFAHLNDGVKDDYKRSLINDIGSRAEYFSGHTVDTVFFGGGTPTCLKSSELCEILDAVLSEYNVSNEAEISLECNPATANAEDFKTLLAGGFNRLSMGLQSAHDNELRELGRIHSFADFQKTYGDARGAGFKNISLDLMYGIPLQTIESFNETLETVLSFEPDHISAYSLKIEPGTEFYKKRGELILPDEDTEYDMYVLADSILSANGYEHYEISNYALNGKRSRHNVKYWSCDEYAGFGVAAHSLIGNTRYSVTDSIEKYVGRASDYFETEEMLDFDSLTEEYIMMRLRLSDGLSIMEYKDKFSVELDEKYIFRMEPFIKSGHIKRNDGRYSLSAEGMYVSNYILSEILDLG